MEFTGHRGSIYHYNGGENDGWLSYACGHCGREVSGAVVTAASDKQTGEVVRWLWCTGCGMPSVQLPDGSILPGLAFGPELSGLPTTVSEAYNETRSCFSVRAFIACELMCRRILMHVAVEKGASEGESFVSYVDFLESSGYTTKAMRDWVDTIRKLGNDSTHSLTRPDEARTRNVLMFTAQLLRTVYEMPHMAQGYQQTP